MKNNTQTEPTDKMNNKWEDHSDEPEWGGWKIVSDMLDNPDEVGIYPTSDCYYKLYLFVKSQRLEAQRELLEEMPIMKLPMSAFPKDEKTNERIFGHNQAVEVLECWRDSKLSQLEPREE